MKALAVVGPKASGKTTVLCALISGLRRKGYRVVAIKHAPHGIELADKDTSKLRESGAVGVLASGDWGTALFWKGDPISLAKSLIDCDFMLLEGFSELKTVPKIICAKSKEDYEAYSDGLEIAVVGPLEGIDVPVFSIKEVNGLLPLVERKAFPPLPGLNCGLCGLDCYGLARKIAKGEASVERCPFVHPRVGALLEGSEIPLNKFAATVTYNVLTALLRSLKGTKPGRAVFWLEYTYSEEPRQ